jgi:hypothetical protein
MDIPEEQVRYTTNFLEAYANTVLSELNDLVDTDENGEASADLRSLITEEPVFNVAADAATTLRELGQWLLYLNPERARDALRRSGELFYAMGQAFGMYLMVVTAELDQEPSHDLFSQPLTVLTRIQKDGGLSETAWDSLRHPQQQAYLVLAASGHPTVNRNRDFSNRLDEVLEASMHARGVVPVGALGTPIRRLWDVARHLHNTGPDAVQVIARHLSEMCRRYAETMELAQVNSHLWNHGAAPVDVGDIDIAGIAAMAARQHGADVLLGALGDAGLLPDRDRIALAPVEAGLALAGRSEPLQAG